MLTYPVKLKPYRYKGKNCQKIILTKRKNIFVAALEAYINQLMATQETVFDSLSYYNVAQETGIPEAIIAHCLLNIGEGDNGFSAIKRGYTSEQAFQWLDGSVNPKNPPPPQT